MSRRVQTMASAHEKLKNGMWTVSPPRKNEKMGGFTLYPRDQSVPNGPCPTCVLPCMVTPFGPNLPKGRETVDQWTKFNLELSVRAHNEDVRDFMNDTNAFVMKSVMANTETIYNRAQMSELELSLRQRSSITCKDKQSPDYPYLLRVKVHPKQTEFFRVTGVTADGKQKFEKATMDDIEPWSICMISAKFSSIYATPMSFGATWFGKSVMIFPPEKRGAEEEEHNEGICDFDGIGGFVRTDEDGAEAAAAPVERAGANDDEDTSPEKRSRSSVPYDDQPAFEEHPDTD
jgi:hypothetical protein